MKEISNYIHKLLPGLVSDILFEPKGGSLTITVYTNNRLGVLKKKDEVKRYLRKSLNKSITFQIKQVSAGGVLSQTPAHVKKPSVATIGAAKVESASKTPPEEDRGVYIDAKQTYIAESLYEYLNDKKAISREGASLLIIVNDSALSNDLNFIYGGKERVLPVVILSFSNLRSLQKKLGGIDEFPELQDCIDKGLILHDRLPIHLEDITTKIGNFRNAFLKNSGDIAQIQAKVAARLRKRQDEVQRHKMNNLMAAARILNGALGSKDYDLRSQDIIEFAKEAYRELIYEDSTNNWSKEKKDYEYADALKTIERSQISCSSSRGSKHIWHRDITKILVIDDQIKMWRPVWEFIFGADKVEIVENGPKGLEKLCSGANYDCVLLDINLGNNAENGIEVLQRIKHAQFDIPVLLLTAYDDVEITKAGLKFGATDYFVKEIIDENDRNSIAYYNKLKNIISSFDVWSADMRKLWRNYHQHIEKKLNIVDTEYGAAKINASLRKALFYLSIDKDYLLPRKILISDDYLADAINNLENALQKLAICIYAEQNKTTYEYSLEIWNGPLKSKEDGRDDYSNAPEKIKELCDLDVEKDVLLRKTFRIARHRDNNRKENFTHKEVIECFNAVFSFSNRVIKNVTVPGATVLSFTPKPSNLDPGKLNLKNRTLAHEEISKRGAAILDEGFTKAGGRKITCRLLFIDNEGTVSPWHAVLSSIFSDVLTVESIKEKNISLISDREMVLLDLNLLSNDYEEGCKKGLETLELIKSWSLTLPVIMLTASNSSFYTKKSLLQDAFDYFTKDTVLEPVNYYNKFISLINRVLRIKDSERLIWTEFDALMQYLDQMITTNNNVNKYASEIRVISSLLKNAYFQFILENRRSELPDIYTIEKLIIEDTPHNDFIMTCGTCAEKLIRLLWRVSNNTASPDTGRLIECINSNDFKDSLATLWRARISSKSNTVKSDLAKHLQTTISAITTGIKYVETNHMCFGRLQSQTYRRNPSVSRPVSSRRFDIFVKKQDKQPSVSKSGLSNVNIAKLEEFKKSIDNKK